MRMIVENTGQDEPKAQQEETKVAGDLRNAFGARPSVYHVLKEQGVISCPLIDFKVGE
ncbi:hypothetical protein D3C87_2114790 [compost metagenome]